MKSRQQFLNQLNSNQFDLIEDDLTLHIENFDVLLEEISPSLLRNKAVAWSLCMKDGSNFENLTAFHDDEDFVNELVEHYPKAYKYASKRIKNMDYIVESLCLGSPQYFELIPDKFKLDKNLILLTFENISSNSSINAAWLSVLSPACDDKELVKEILSRNKGIYQYLNENLKNNDEIIKLTLTDYYQFKNLPDSKKEELQYMSLACKNSGIAIKNFTPNALNDSLVMSNFLNKYPGAIFWCGEKIKNNESIALDICGEKLNPHPYAFFSESVRSNSSIAKKSILANVLSGEHLPISLAADKEFAKQIIETSAFDYKVLQWFDEAIKDNVTVMKLAIEKDLQSMKYLGSELKNDKDFIGEFLSITESNMYNQLSKWKKVFTLLSYEPHEFKSFSIFLEKIQDYMADKSYQEQSSAFKSFLNELKQSPLKDSLIDGDAIMNYNSVLLKESLDSTLSGKKHKVKIKI